MDNDTQVPAPAPEKSPTSSAENKQPSSQARGSGGGWGGWGFSSFSVLSDLQKAAEEMSRNAVEAAKSAAKGIADLSVESDLETADEDAFEKLAGGEGEPEGEEESEEDKRRRAALDRLGNASEDTLFGQSLKVIDTSVESFASGAWSVLGNALKGGASLVSKLESSAVNLADSIQQGNLPAKATSIAPSIIETGKTFTSKGMEVLEQVGKGTMELLGTETGLDAEKSSNRISQGADDEQFEEITFDRCFYIYGGPDQLEELEALSSHHALLFNRKKAKLLAEQKSLYDGKLKQMQQIFQLGTPIELDGAEADKGMNIETLDVDSDIDIKTLRDSSVKRASDMAKGFTSAVGELAANDIVQKTSQRLETIHSECIHRLSEFCSCAISQLLLLGKSVISCSNKGKTDEPVEDTININWPEDSLLKAKMLRWKAESISGDMEAVSNSFITGISDIIAAYLDTLQSDELPEKKSLQEKANMIIDRLKVDGSSAVEKIQDALQYLAYVVLSTSMPTV